MKLSSKQRRAILDSVEDMFETLKARLLGRFFKGPKIYFEMSRRANPIETIEGLFQYTNAMLYGAKTPVDEEHVEQLAEVTGNYIEAKKEDVSQTLLSHINDAETPEQAMAAVKDSLESATSYVDMLVANESRTAQAYAERSGITKLGASMGIEDPTVCKLGIIDDDMCENCRELWHDPTNKFVPKVYKLSELKEGYMTDHKNPYPTVGPTHPRCRHVLTFLPPNFGFTDKGHIEFKSFGHDEYEAQNSNKK